MLAKRPLAGLLTHVSLALCKVAELDIVVDAGLGVGLRGHCLVCGGALPLEHLSYEGERGEKGGGGGTNMKR